MPPDEQPTNRFWSDAAAIALGTLMTLAVSGYQFGRGNHTVYLLEGLRLNDATLLQHDWFVTSTLQYHAIFSRLTAMLMRLNILEPAFLIGYIGLAIAWHIAWLLLARKLGASRTTYLFSVLLYYISAGGISLGVYQFLQDGCFLPSNVSNIAMLWGFYFWIIGRRDWAGFLLGLAGLFHLNYAVVAIGAWCALSAWSLLDRRSFKGLLVPWIIGSILLFAPSLFNIVNALSVKLHESGAIPLDEFVRIYVRFRHTHHFDPLAWPVSLWVSFLWPIPFAVVAWQTLSGRAKESEADASVLRDTARIFALMLALQLIAFVFAGLWYVSESLVQLMLWRFSIYVKLLSCIGAAIFICQVPVMSARMRKMVVILIPLCLALFVCLALLAEGRVHARGLEIALAAMRDHAGAVVLFALLALVPGIANLLPARVSSSVAISIGALLACIVVAVIGWNRWLGVGMTPELVDADYLELCHWAREATPVDAVFLAPPAETAFRLEAHRAIVVNFKHVPQLGGEIVQWIDRLEDVLGTRDLSVFPRDYVKMLAALDEQYESRPAEALLAVARKYEARYIVVDHDLGEQYIPMRIYHPRAGRYFVYDRQRR